MCMRLWYPHEFCVPPVLCAPRYDQLVFMNSPKYEIHLYAIFSIPPSLHPFLVNILSSTSSSQRTQTCILLPLGHSCIHNNILCIFHSYLRFKLETIMKSGFHIPTKSSYIPVALCVSQYVQRECVLGDIDPACCSVNACSTLHRLSRNTQLPEKLPSCSWRGVSLLFMCDPSIWLYSWYNKFNLCHRRKFPRVLLCELEILDVEISYETFLLAN